MHIVKFQNIKRFLQGCNVTYKLLYVIVPSMVLSTTVVTKKILNLAFETMQISDGNVQD